MSTSIAPDAPAVNRPGQWVDTAPGLELGADLPTRISTDRYTSPAYAEAERDAIWMRTWQVVGRADAIPHGGDYMEHKIYEQSYVVVRGHDGVVRGFVNACRHRGNLLCPGKGHAAKLVCPYHLWSYDLKGRLERVLRPDLCGDIDKEELSLIPVQVDTLAGFVFLNPDPDAAPLADYVGADLIALLEPYHLEQFVPVMDVREEIECNWKVVIDAFSEGYHIPGIHPELLKVIVPTATESRFRFDNDHSVAVAPFDLPHSNEYGPEQQVAGIRDLPATFPGTAAIIPTFDVIVEEYRQPDGTLVFPDGVTGRTLLQRATRQSLTEGGLDVSGLTDAQMTDNQGWVLFPNFFMTVRAGECHVILPTPHPSGDPHKCHWHVSSYMYLPDELAEAFRVELTEVDPPGTHEYFLALQQDYDQMPRQQAGLRSSELTYIHPVHEEIIVKRFNDVVDRYMTSFTAKAGQ